MRKLILTLALACEVLSMHIFAQSWSTSGSSLYVNPLTTKVGIGISSPTQSLQVLGSVKIGNASSESDRTKSILYFGDGSYVQIGEWEADDVLSFKANSYRFQNGKVGINTTPTYTLDVKGKMYLQTAEVINNWNYSYLYWGGHSLVMGSPAGMQAHNVLELKPGGANGSGPLFSSIRLFTANGVNNHVQRIEIQSEGNSWFNNTGNIGIGTQLPTHKLDVRGTIRANEILVNIPSGADFVFEDGYSLMPIDQLSSYVKENKHLPEIAPAKTMEEEGLTMGEMQIRLLQKIEELTLYIIEQDKRIQALENDLK